MITLTETASNKVKHFLEQRGKGLGIKIGVRTSGCSGMAYTLEYLDAIENWAPVVFDSQDVRVYVDKKDLAYIDGTTLDWTKQGINEGFEFVNPNEASKCGCGESFNV
jgi:iron-sulfur cluster assembly protein